jgi:Uma2 family endonuclease
MASDAVIPRFTPEQYLALERKADFKSEYRNGYIVPMAGIGREPGVAMAGTSRKHSLIAGNIYRKIGNQLEERPSEVHISDMRVRVSPTGLYTYPDVVAVCGEAEFEDDEFDTLLNPTVIVEVLSPTTEADDRGDKFGQYRELMSLREYVVIAQDNVLVERYTRQGEQWLLKDFRSLDESLRLASIDCEIPLREIYAKVKLPGVEAAGS